MNQYEKEFIKRFNETKTSMCYGCTHKTASLKDHDCWETEYDEVIAKEVLETLFKEGKISEEFKNGAANGRYL
jgi:hypothetical protein